MSLDAFFNNHNFNSDIHPQLKHWVEEKFKEDGYDVELEKYFNTTAFFDFPNDAIFIDVYAQKEGGVVAIECEGYLGKLKGYLWREGILKNFSNRVLFAFPKNINTVSLEKGGIGVLHTPIVKVTKKEDDGK